MAHKSNNSDLLTKTFKLKANIAKSEIHSKWLPSIEEYTQYYNGVSNWICKNLTEMKISDLAQFIKNTKSAYYQFVTDESIADLPLYKIFTMKQTQCVDNALYCAISCVNPEDYKGNMLGLGETDYRRFGYVQAVVANYRQKISTMKASVKFKTLPENPSYEILFEQTMHEMVEKDLTTNEDWERIISNYKERQVEQTRKIERFEKLFVFFKEHSEEIKEKANALAIEQLKSFNGCCRKSVTAMSIHKQKSKIEKDGKASFLIYLPFNKKSECIKLFGNRQIVKIDSNGNRVDLIDIENNHGDIITIQIKNDELYVIITAKTDFSKENNPIKNVVGVDVNIKHSVIATSIVDNGNVIGYVNIYKELLNDEEFRSTCSNEDIKMYEEMAKSVNFGLLECVSLFSRVSSQIYGDNEDVFKLDAIMLTREKVIEKVLKRLSKELRDIDCKSATYIDYVKIMRDSYKSYFILKQKYYEKRKEYDIEMRFVDESTKSKSLMDKRRFENPFVNTETAKEILEKLNRIESRLIGCRDNITTYAFNVFQNNGFDTIALEYLDSSQFDKARMLTPTSMLKYHNFEGKTLDYAFNSELRFNKNNYNFVLDNNGKIIDIEYTVLGKREVKKTNFFNLIIKAIHFADIKDKFVQLSNNTSMNVIFVPSAFSSQMDSFDHKLYVDEEGKLVDKRKVRKQQETHINGLNADFNAACNLSYIPTDIKLLEKVCMKSKSGIKAYSSPYWDVKQAFKKNVSSNMMETIKKMKMTKVLSV